MSQNENDPISLTHGIHHVAVEDLVRTIERALRRIGAAVHPEGVVGVDPAGISVGCVTEALGGMTKALLRVAESGQNIADAIHDLGIRNEN
jgi:hypothetical protein